MNPETKSTSALIETSICIVCGHIEICDRLCRAEMRRKLTMPLHEFAIIASRRLINVDVNSDTESSPLSLKLHAIRTEAEAKFEAKVLRQFERIDN
jgi:hypothetical protein